MGGGDLNMKKSWHPLLIKNQERVWKEEQKAMEEQKKLNQLRKEKEEERQLQELRQIQATVGGRREQERLDWMYAAGPNQSSSAKAEEMEDYLLGKKRVDSLIEQGTSMSKLSADSKEIFSSISNPNANTYRDTQAKIREDPLFLIKKTEQANIKSIVSNPLKMREIQEDSHKERSKKHHKKRPLEDSDADSVRSEEQDRNHRSQKRSRLSRSRSRSCSRDKYNDKHRHESRYSNSTNRGRDSREKRFESRYSSNNRDRDTYENRNESQYSNRTTGDRDSDLHEERHNRHERRYDNGRRHSPHRYRRNDRSDNNSPYDSKDYKEGKKHYGQSEADKIKAKEEAEKRIFEMMNDAKKISEERKKRVEQSTKEEYEEEKKLDEDRKRRGMQSDFLKNAYKSAYSSQSSIGLGERLQRHRGTSQKISSED
ncbi:8126_t:CDS:2 [Funneliformis geosporum]|uniref:15359_t:CDS:1 n=1 Tax=Funneliformis geosporum TaxID=1117311 RepID=A0A9W4WJZ7_9GLOM|nr:8126_t:CDS:2 [Funneliformis geosporum]CAI2167506.1 15359_t:CDS:2 [Funneliformis geosporum]